jgi:putative transcriptional regulator
LRQSRGWSQRELGERVGISRQAVIAIENEKFDPSLPVAMRMATVFELRVEAIFTLDLSS